MFTWIPIHEEAAKRLLDFKDRQYELVGILARMHAAGLKATLINDQGPNGSTFQLKEIDPFSFLANFNRRSRDSNRQGLWKMLKAEWELTSAVPEDFNGLPLANAQNSWLMPYAKDRSPEHVPLLWKFFEHIMTVEPESLDADLMQQCLGLPHVGMTMLTMGMFWACPRKWISTDGKNIEYAATKGCSGKPENSMEYLRWLPEIIQVIGGDGVDFSRQAHLFSLDSSKPSYGEPFKRMFPPNEADAVLDVFSAVLKVIEEEAPDYKRILAFTFGNTSKAIPQLVINVGMWAAIWYEVRAGVRLLSFVLLTDHPEVQKQHGAIETNWVVDGKMLKHVSLPVAEFFARHDELLPGISDAVRAASRHFADRKGTPFIRHHRPELVMLATDPDERERLLRQGLVVKPNVSKPIKPQRYWMIAPGEGAKCWDQWTDQGIAAIGWKQVGDLGDYDSKEAIQVALEDAFPEKDQSGVALMLWNFRNVMSEGDVIFAKLGRTEVIGWGVVRSGYSFDADQEDLANVIPVDWVERNAIKLPEGRMLPIKSLTEITDDSDLLEILSENYAGVPGLKSSSGGTATISPVAVNLPQYRIEDALAELFMARESIEHILEQLRRKKNIILQGAPGVGKTFIAKRLAWLQLGAKDHSAVDIVQFHQSYTYEDFVQGLRPSKDGHFEVKDGVFYRLCRKSLANPQQEYFLVIDEINRGNLSKILGELMMLIETDKRGESLTLAYSEEPFTVPPNLYLIGTMNTADRSLSLVDYALRRRFAFLTLDPGFSEKTFSTHLGKHGLAPGQIKHVVNQMEALNLEIAEDKVNLGKGYRIGHSFFTPTAPVADFQKWWQAIVRYEIMPLLEEYWIDDPQMVQRFRLTLTEGLP